MPFASLRRKTIGDRPASKGHDQPPSPARTRFRAVPSLTPRKSFSTLVETNIRGRAASASPMVSPSDPPEQDLGSRQDPDPSLPDILSEAAEQTPLQDQLTSLKRSPSPHPLKWRGNPPSLRSRIDRANLSRSHSDTSLQETASKTFLEAIADAIKAPTFLFYRDTKSAKTLRKTEETLDSSGNQDTPPLVTPEHRKASPKKSVRFRPGSSIINDVEKSSPINIPRAFPTLPPVQLATTPLLQCFGKTSFDQIPTARPPQTQILNSSAEFRQAIIEAQSAIPFLDLDQDANPVNPPTNLPTPLPGTNLSMDDPFAHAVSELSPEANQTLLAKYEDHFPNKTLLTCTTTDLPADSPSASTTVGDQSPKGSNTFLSMGFPEHPSHSSLPRSSSMQPQRQTKRVADILGPIISTSPLLQPSDPAPLPLSQDSSNPGHKKLHLARSKFSQPHHPASSKFDAVMHASISECHSIHDQTDMAPTVSTPENVAVSEKWNKTPTHEDIRQQFRVPRLGKSVKKLGSFEVEGSSQLSKDSAVTAPTETLETLDILGSFEDSRESETVASYAAEKERWEKPQLCSPHPSGSQVTSNGLTFQDAFPAFLETSQPPWTAELALRSDKPTQSKPTEVALCDHTPLYLYHSHNRRLNNTDEVLESLSITSLPSTKHARQIAEQISYSPEDTENMSTPVPSSRLVSLNSMSSITSDMSSPSCIHLPMSAHPQDRAFEYRGEDGWSPFDEPQFTYAAMAACETDEAGMRSLLSLQGGFHAFWQESQLPQSTSPAQDTRGLTNAEIERLIVMVKESRTWQGGMTTQFVDAYKIKFNHRLSPAHSAFHTNECDDGAKVDCEHPHPEVTGGSAYTNGSEDNLHSDSKQHSFEASPVVQERTGVHVLIDEHEHDTDGTKAVDSMSLRRAASIDPGTARPGGGHGLAGVETEVEGAAQGSDEDHKGQSRPRRETMQSHNSQDTGRRSSTWSARSGHSSRTSVDSTAMGMAEDEDFCRGIV